MFAVNREGKETALDSKSSALRAEVDARFTLLVLDVTGSIGVEVGDKG